MFIFSVFSTLFSFFATALLRSVMNQLRLGKQLCKHILATLTALCISQEIRIHNSNNSGTVRYSHSRKYVPYQFNKGCILQYSNMGRFCILRYSWQPYWGATCAHTHTHTSMNSMVRFLLAFLYLLLCILHLWQKHQIANNDCNQRQLQSNHTHTWTHTYTHNLQLRFAVQSVYEACLEVYTRKHWVA